MIWMLVAGIVITVFVVICVKAGAYMDDYEDDFKNKGEG